MAKNQDGFEAGEMVSHRDLMTALAKQRNAPISDESKPDELKVDKPKKPKAEAEKEAE